MSIDSIKYATHDITFLNYFTIDSLVNILHGLPYPQLDLWIPWSHYRVGCLTFYESEIQFYTCNATAVATDFKGSPGTKLTSQADLKDNACPKQSATNLGKTLNKT